MRVSLAIAALLASLVVAGPVTAAPPPSAAAAAAAAASDTARERAVHRDTASPRRWVCTPTGCTGAPASSSASAVLGFAVVSLAAAGISRRRPPSTA